MSVDRICLIFIAALYVRDPSPTAQDDCCIILYYYTVLYINIVLLASSRSYNFNPGQSFQLIRYVGISGPVP